MIYLIGQLSLWLLLTAAFAAVAGWAFAAERSARAEQSLQRDRQKLLRDIIKLASDGSDSGEGVEDERETEAARRLVEIRDARIAELEQAADAARARVNDAAGQIAELERRLAHGGSNGEELTRLRSQVADLEEAKRREIEIPATPVADAAAEEANALQSWRLRYFEQRVRYLETLSRAEPAPDAAAADTQPLEWRLRDAEAQAAYLEGALRDAVTATPRPHAETTPVEEEAPFAANADVDTLLRWRLLYLERRVGHLQQELAQPAPVPPPAAPELATSEDPDRWKWRARYLEARMRHLEERPAPLAPVQARTDASWSEDELEPVSPTPSSRRGAKPPVLPAPHHGAPDDLTLIEGVSLLQQTTLYSLGVFHFEQIAAWTPDNVAWVDAYLRLRGRIDEEEWVEQAAELTDGLPSRSFDEVK